MSFSMWACKILFTSHAYFTTITAGFIWSGLDSLIQTQLAKYLWKSCYDLGKYTFAFTFFLRASTRAWTSSPLLSMAPAVLAMAQLPRAGRAGPGAEPVPDSASPAAAASRLLFLQSHHLHLRSFSFPLINPILFSSSWPFYSWWWNLWGEDINERQSPPPSAELELSCSSMAHKQTQRDPAPVPQQDIAECMVVVSMAGHGPKLANIHFSGN